MKKYKLEKNSQNEQQHQMFLNQYKAIKDSSDRTSNHDLWLELNEYRLNIQWLDIEDAEVVEDKPVVADVKPKAKPRKKTVKK